ncbi:Cysteine protease ATG4B [Thelohanellus kitauei]|uniref:Cysteine protease n=1 Tax=Thelohanellus kitauei TaxID=669202 RepID=A0A0C2MMX7_THEKT|nr:Cysteine protease ATG4B [Thelohanellus kitauei]
MTTLFILKKLVTFNNNTENLCFCTNDIQWVPILLVICIGLGKSKIEEKRANLVLNLMQFDSFAGLIAGIGYGAMYFFGSHGNKLLYLDPHTTRKVSENIDDFNLSSEFTDINSVNILKIGSEMCISFLFKTPEQFEKWIVSSRKISNGLFIIKEGSRADRVLTKPENRGAEDFVFL